MFSFRATSLFLFALLKIFNNTRAVIISDFNVLVLNNTVHLNYALVCRGFPIRFETGSNGDLFSALGGDFLRVNEPAFFAAIGDYADSLNVEDGDECRKFTEKAVAELKPIVLERMPGNTTSQNPTATIGSYESNEGQPNLSKRITALFASWHTYASRGCYDARETVDATSCYDTLYVTYNEPRAGGKTYNIQADYAIAYWYGEADWTGEYIFQILEESEDECAGNLFYINSLLAYCVICSSCGGS